MGLSVSTRKQAMHGPVEASGARLRGSPGAARMRRHRSLKRQGAVAVDFVVGADAVRSLIELGWLDPEHRSDRDAVRSAIIRLAARALALRIPPGG